MSDQTEVQRKGSRSRAIVGAIVAIAVVAVVAYLVGRPDSAQADILYQDRLEPGPDPFSDPVDIKDADVHYGGPFGGSGDNTVCKPSLLLRFLKTHPAERAAWLGVLGVKEADLEDYIESLRPVILNRDIRVTNHGFKNGRAYELQSILQKGTAVLVDEKGNIVVRCRCGNPLKPPKPTSGRCRGCPPSITTVEPCDGYCFEWSCPIDRTCPPNEPEPKKSPTPSPGRPGVPVFPKPSPTPPQGLVVPVYPSDPTPTPIPNSEGDCGADCVPVEDTPKPKKRQPDPTPYECNPNYEQCDYVEPEPTYYPN